MKQCRACQCLSGELDWLVRDRRESSSWEISELLTRLVSFGVQRDEADVLFTQLRLNIVPFRAAAALSDDLDSPLLGTSLYVAPSHQKSFWKIHVWKQKQSETPNKP